MLGSKIRNARNALGILLGTGMTQEQLAVIRLTILELTDAADAADDLEMSLQYWFQRPTDGEEKTHA